MPRSAIAEWVEDFNTARSHFSLGYQTPAAYANHHCNRLRRCAGRRLRASAGCSTCAKRRNRDGRGSNGCWTKVSCRSAAITSVTDSESDEINPSTNLEQRRSLRSGDLPERATEMMRIQGVSGRWEEGPRVHATKLCSCYVPSAMAARVASSCDGVRGRLRNTHHVRRHDPNGLSVAYDSGNRRLSSLA